MRRRAIVRMLPRSRRERYGEEIAALLERTRGPSDPFNVAVLAARWHVEETMRDIWSVLAIVVAAASLFALGYATNGLADGITELPRHWWSTAPILGLFLAVTLAAVGRIKRRRRPKTSR